MDRRDRILAGLDLQRMTGLEIGALDRPIVRPEDGASALYVDHVDRQTLRQKYAHDPGVNPDALVDVHVVLSEGTLREALEARAAIHPDTPRRVDYVIASHVIEHVPDLIGWLNEIHEVLKPSGQLRLAVPDRRFTFDCLREDARLSDVLAAYLAGTRRPTLQAVLDGLMNAVQTVNAVKLWSGDEDIAGLVHATGWEHNIGAARETLAGVYHDVHCWAVTPYSLADIFIPLAEHSLLRFACHSFADTLYGDCEFHLTLVPSDDQARVAESWRQVKREAQQTAPGSRFRPVDVLSGAYGSADAEPRRLAKERLNVAQEMESRARRAEALAEERLHLVHRMEDRARTAESLVEERLDLVRRMEDRALRAEAMVTQMQQSSSWRVTEPLRTAVHLLRRAGSRGETSRG
jgi:predicted SAM-dependent methyltransferase